MTDQTENKKAPATKVEPEIVIETGKLFTVETPNGVISETGMREVQNYMYDKGLGTLPSDFEAIWTGKRGTLPKRISAHCYKTAKLRLTTEQVSELGNIARRHTSQAETYILDFTKSFDWKAGAFGDSGSCFWGSNSGARLMLEANGAYAVRGYHKIEPELELDYKNVRGYSRAWVIKLVGNRLIVFNGYPSGSLDFARILALKYSLSYKKLNLTNHGQQGGLLYINSGSYVVGAFAKIEAMTAYDLDYDDIESEPDEPEYICSQCDSEIACEDDIAYSLNRYGDSEACCSDCSFFCERCQEQYVASLQRELDGDYYCRDCRESILQERADEQEQEAMREQEATERQEQERQEQERADSDRPWVAVAVESEDN